MKKPILMSAIAAFFTVMATTAYANCYCQQGMIQGGGQCVAPAGPNNSIVVIGYAICQGSAPSQEYSPPPRNDYWEHCEQTRDGGQACSVYYDDWVSFTDFSDRDGKMIFRRIYYLDRRGSVKSESSYNGKDNRHGKTVHYYENGQPKYVMNYVNNKAQGEELQYHENGKLKGIIYYDNGEFHGQFRFFDENGQLILIETYDKGKKIHSRKYQNGQKAG